jgi:hypothetical protein
VTINGSGSLDAVGGDGSAGIGGSWNQDNGTVIIEGGTVNAEGGFDATGIGGGAGIGGGGNGSCGTIRISGGTVNATAGWHGAGIGGGAGGAGGTITINYPSGTSVGAAQSLSFVVEVSAGRAVGPGENGSGGSFNGVEGNWPPDTKANFRTYEW